MFDRLAKIRIAVLAALLVGMTSSAMARVPGHHGPQGSSCYTDEGQGRYDPCDEGGA
jgi:hypothetical protein